MTKLMGLMPLLEPTKSPCIQRVFQEQFDADVIRLRTPGRNDIDTAVKVNIIDPISPKPDGTAQAVALNVETGVDQNATQYTGVQHNYLDSGGDIAGDVIAFKSQSGISDSGNRNIGFFSVLNSEATGENYHFYGQGHATVLRILEV